MVENQKIEAKDVSFEEKQEIAKTPSIYANRVYIGSTAEGIIRLTFGDQALNDLRPIPKMTIILAFPVVLTLKHLIDNFLQAQMQMQTSQPSPDVKPNKEELN